ncbi:MAG: type II secretion system protein [Bacilli bacterium]|nr:type II secretion system protein [Bacilli bacterium]
MNNKGFSIVELLIVIVVMSIISAFSITAVDQILDNTKQNAFVANGEIILAAAKSSYTYGDAIWDDDVATLGEIIDAGYIEINSTDPWGGLYNLSESYVLSEVILVSSNEIFLSVSSFSLVESTMFKLKLVSTTAIIGNDEPLEEFTKNDIVFSVNSSTIIEKIIEMFGDDLDSDFTTDDGDDEVDVDKDVSNEAIINLQGGNDTLNIGDDVLDGSVINMGDGDDVINMDGEIKDGSMIDTGDGNDTVNIGDDIQDDAVVNTGAGDDIVVVDDDLQDGGILNTGDGNDVVSVNDELDNGTIITGKGEDTITVDTIRNTSYIDTGDDNDTLFIRDVSSSFDNGSVTLGDGDDTLTIEDDLVGSKGTWDGGTGDDVLNLLDVKIKDWNKTISQYFVNFETINLKDGTIYLN